MDDFLEHTFNSLNCLDDFDVVHVVIGNEACDLDSAVSAISYAYYLSQLCGHTETIFLPVLNIPKHDYHLRTEIASWSKSCEIDANRFIFRDHIDLHAINDRGCLLLTLVDHNLLLGKDAVLNKRVVSVIDHHVIEGVPNDSCSTTVEMVGSCCTLVADLLLKTESFRVSPQLATFLYGPILLDTVNLSDEAGRKTLKDVVVVDRLEAIFPHMAREKVFADLQKAKFDVTGLSNAELFTRDLKIATSQTMNIAVSSVTMNIKELMKRQYLRKDMEMFCTEKQVEAHIIMTLHFKIPTTPKRRILVFSTNDISRKIILDALKNASNPSLELIPMPCRLDRCEAFIQGNFTASRKQVLPVIKELLKSAPMINQKEEVAPTEGTDTLTTDGTLPNPFTNEEITVDDNSTNIFEKDIFGQNDLLGNNTVSDSGNGISTNPFSFDDMSGGNTSLNPFSTDSGLSSDLLSGDGPSTVTSVNPFGSGFDELDPFSPQPHAQSATNDNNVQTTVPDDLDPFGFGFTSNPPGGGDDAGSPMLSNLEADKNVGLMDSDSTEKPSSVGVTVNEPHNTLLDALHDQKDIMEGFDPFSSDEPAVSSGGYNTPTSRLELDDPISQNSSYPGTPPSSFADTNMSHFAKETVLPSFNSSEMVQRIKNKKDRLDTSDLPDDDDFKVAHSDDELTLPFTPSSSYQDNTADRMSKETNLPSFMNSEMVQRIHEKRGELDGSNNLSPPQDPYPFTPRNSFCEGSLEGYRQKKSAFDKHSSDELVQLVLEKKSSLEELQSYDEEQGSGDILISGGDGIDNLSPGVSVSQENNDKLSQDVSIEGNNADIMSPDLDVKQTSGGDILSPDVSLNQESVDILSTHVSVEGNTADVKSSDIDVKPTSGGDILLPDISVNQEGVSVSPPDDFVKQEVIVAMSSQDVSAEKNSADNESSDLDMKQTCDGDMLSPDVSVKQDSVDVVLPPDVSVKQEDIVDMSSPYVSVEGNTADVKSDIDMKQTSGGDMLSPNVSVKKDGIDVLPPDVSVKQEVIVGMLSPDVSVEGNTADGKSTDLDVKQTSSDDMLSPDVSVKQEESVVILSPDVSIEENGADIKSSDLNVKKASSDDTLSPEVSVKQDIVDMSLPDVSVEGNTADVKSSDLGVKQTSSDDILSLDISVNQESVDDSTPDASVNPDSADILSPDVSVKQDSVDIFSTDVSAAAQSKSLDVNVKSDNEITDSSIHEQNEMDNMLAGSDSAVVSQVISAIDCQSEDEIQQVADVITQNIIDKALDSFPVSISQTFEGEEPMNETSVNAQQMAYEAESPMDSTESDDVGHTVIVPRYRVGSLEIPVETDYLSTVDPLQGQMDIVYTNKQTFATDAVKDLAENTSFERLRAESAEEEKLRETEIQAVKDVEEEAEMDEQVIESDNSHSIDELAGLEEIEMVSETIAVSEKRLQEVEVSSKEVSHVDRDEFGSQEYENESRGIYSPESNPEKNEDLPLDVENVQPTQKMPCPSDVLEDDHQKENSLCEPVKHDSSHITVSDVATENIIPNTSVEAEPGPESASFVVSTTSDITSPTVIAASPDIASPTSVEVLSDTTLSPDTVMPTAVTAPPSDATTLDAISPVLQADIFAVETPSEVGSPLADQSDVEPIVVEKADAPLEAVNAEESEQDRVVFRNVQLGEREEAEGEEAVKTTRTGSMSSGELILDELTQQILSDEDKEHAERPQTLDASGGALPKRKILPNLEMLDNDQSFVSHDMSATDLLAMVDDMQTPDDLETPDFDNTLLRDISMEDDTPTSDNSPPIPEYSAMEELENERRWRTVDIAGKHHKVDMKVIEPYKKVLSHGGYYGDGFNAIVVFAACYLPDRSRKDYHYVMDNLFLYVISTLELLVVENYMIIYFHGATPKKQMPGLSWLKKCYQFIDRRLRKNLKKLYLVHPTMWLKTVMFLTKPFISSKFTSKIRYVSTLSMLSNEVSLEYVYIPDQIRKIDHSFNSANK